MDHYSRVRVIKRAERERLGKSDAGGASGESPAQEKARGLASTVKEWISEFQHQRLARHQEITQQLGWPQARDDSPNQKELMDPDKGEK